MVIAPPIRLFLCSVINVYCASVCSVNVYPMYCCKMYTRLFGNVGVIFAKPQNNKIILNHLVRNNRSLSKGQLCYKISHYEH